MISMMSVCLYIRDLIPRFLRHPVLVWKTLLFGEISSRNLGTNYYAKQRYNLQRSCSDRTTIAYTCDSNCAIKLKIKIIKRFYAIRSVAVKDITSV